MAICGGSRWLCTELDDYQATGAGVSWLPVREKVGYLCEGTGSWLSVQGGRWLCMLEAASYMCTEVQLPGYLCREVVGYLCEDVAGYLCREGDGYPWWKQLAIYARRY